MGLAVESQRKVPSDTAPEGIVVEQGYPAGTEVKSGTAVNIGVSSGPQQVSVLDTPIQSAVAASASAPASAPASATVSPTTTVSAAASAPALEKDAGEEVEGGNSGPGSDNSGSGNSGSGGD